MVVSCPPRGLETNGDPPSHTFKMVNEKSERVCCYVGVVTLLFIVKKLKVEQRVKQPSNERSSVWRISA
jgi:hypothetical protein